jgi:hypothetical protein
MTIHKLALVLLFLLPALSFAQGPATRDSRPRPKGSPRAQWRPPPDESVDWDKVQKFFEENSPNRWAAFKIVIDDKSLSDEQRKRLKNLLVMRYRGIQFFANEGHHELLQLKKQQIRIEDDIFKIRQDLGKAAASSPEADKLKADLRARVEALVDSRMKEREERINRLQAVLQDETSALARFRENRENLIEELCQSELSGGPSGLLPDFPRHRAPNEETPPKRPRDDPK